MKEIDPELAHELLGALENLKTYLEDDPENTPGTDLYADLLLADEVIRRAHKENSLEVVSTDLTPYKNGHWYG